MGATEHRFETPSELKILPPYPRDEAAIGEFRQAEDSVRCRPFFLNRLSLLCFWAALATLVGARPHDGVEYAKLTAAGIPIHLVTVDLSRTDLVVRPVIAPAGQRYTMGQFVKAHRPLAAINGTFFDTLTGITVGNLVSKGRLLSEGMAGSNLVFRHGGRIELVSSGRNLGRYVDWADADFAIGGGPTLLADGQYVLDPGSEGFSDPSLFRPRPRTAMGVTSDGRLRMVVVTEGVTLWTLARVMKDLGCVHALNLDGGSSSAMSVGGSTMVAPQRRLTNMVGVFSVARDADLGRALGVAQTRASQHFQRGSEYQSLGMRPEARSQMRQAVAKAPGEPTYWTAAGLSEQAMNNRPRALADLGRAVAIYQERGDMVATFETAQMILDIDTTNLHANLVCGESLIEQGLDEDAMPYLEAVLALSPGHQQAIELIEGVKFRARSKEALRVPEQSLILIAETLGAVSALGDSGYNFSTITLPME